MENKWTNMAMRKECLPMIKLYAKIIQKEQDRMKPPTLSEAVFVGFRELMRTRGVKINGDEN
tara:strand:+ start:111 stop:296 length:186 start_codon:yes stop_codon:yes gene_type:complete